jgi:hypothetical protein
MSDSLNATVIVIVLVLTISANGELEPVDVEADDELEPPSPPAVVPVPPGAEELDDDPLPELVAVEAFDVDPADTESPVVRLARETMVPLIGA